MSEVHTYDTIRVKAKDITPEHVLVGESGGLSAVYTTFESYIMKGCQVLETEHGALYIDTHEELEVLK